MEIDISARHFHVTEALKAYVIDKTSKLEKYSLKLETAHVILEVQKFRHICEITAMGKNSRFTAKEESADMYAAFDKSFGNIQLQLRRYHDRLRDHKARRYKLKP
ncbi:MAG: ribosome-associated translation inhibitor RaiA [Candidatus Omnitrophica bacterium]|nr:ribosome-associated translation inhibitor RaiA [Candidatus Omnitrophota bacterium]